jgi:L-lactate dehydrogenase (cytochrome)
MNRLDGAEVAKHNDRKSCWIAIHGKVYDVTGTYLPCCGPTYVRNTTLAGFLDDHPGGAQIILKSAGQDATAEYENVHSPDLIAETLPSTAFRGTVDASTIPTSKTAEGDKRQQRPKTRFPPLRSMFSVNDFEVVAKRYLSPTGWAYYSSAADDEYSKQEAARTFRKLTLRARVLRDIGSVDARTTILGKSTSLPVYVSPSGLAKYAHPDAECAFARGAGKEGIIQVIPTSPSMSIESIIGARVSKDQPVFFQLYLNRDPQKAEALIRRVERLGVSAIWLTVDSPVLGNREQDDRLKARMDEDDQVVVAEEVKPGVAKVASSGLLNPHLTWDHLAWIRQRTKLPLVLKGIQSVEDAVLAYDHGVEGIVLSNHGGRSQDT